MASHRKLEQGDLNAKRETASAEDEEDRGVAVPMSSLHDNSTSVYHEVFGGHTQSDTRDMRRMGKTQELRRDYRPLSALAFTVIIQGTWEVLLTATTQGLVDGGPAGLIWSYVWTFIGFTFIVASLAEMASMAPCVFFSP